MKTYKNRFIAILFAAIIAITVCGCDKIKLVPGHSSGFDIPDTSKEENIKPYPLTINGTEISKEIKSVISLTPAYTEIICEMGYGSKLIAVSSYCDYPEDIIKKLPKVSGSANPDIEKIIELSPDIVITATPIISKDKIRLEQNGISVLTIPAPQSIAQIKQTYEFFGLAFNGIFSGKEIGDKAFSVVENKTGGIKKDEKLKFVYITAALTAAGGSTLESDVLSLFGENIAKDSDSYSYDKENLLKAQPDVIFLSDAFKADDLMNDKIYGQLDAVKTGRIIILENIYFERPTTRIIKIIEKVPEELKKEPVIPESSSDENEDSSTDHSSEEEPSDESEATE